VEAFVVDAFKTKVFIELVALIVPTFISPAVRVEITPEIALKIEAKKFVEVELSEVKFVVEAFTIE
jgi:hypothetical protein